LLKRLGVDAAAGLSSAEAARRLSRYGPNELRDHGQQSAWKIALRQFADAMIVLLILAAAVTGLLGDREDTIVILAIVVLNAAIGFAQEYRAERAVQALKRLGSAHARVRRAGAIMTIPERQVVPGDIVLLEAGALVPADLRLIEAVGLQVEEAMLTGESHPANKEASASFDGSVAIGDRVNAAFKGTLVVGGRGTGVAVATGMRTEFGKIAALLARTDRSPTPLQRRLTRFGGQLSLAAIVICALVFVLGWLRGESLIVVFLTAVSLAVAAVPEALPVVLNLALALGAQRMVKIHVLARQLSAVETLGAVTYVCSDKTGTLTRNELRVEAIATVDDRRSTVRPGLAERDPWRSLLRAVALNNDVAYGAGGAAVGDPTEIALDLAAREAGLAKDVLASRAPRIAELPFDSSRKRMTTLHRQADGRVVAFMKGAPERVLERCSLSLGSDGEVAFDRQASAALSERLAAEGLRVLAFAYRSWAVEPQDLSPDELENDLTFLGFVGLVDPPRPEAAAAVAECRSAGIVPVMITGDHPLTARRIAVQLGILDDGGAVLTGSELSRTDAAQLAAVVSSIRVYARVDPEQKIKIVEALQQAGEVVAMTGDGVNDAPALKRADVGIAMGNIGTDVAREAAHVILTDDNFASIVAGIREGRRIFDNIRKFIRFVLSGNAAEILTILIPPLFGLPLALLPIHILWINLVTDGLPGLALAAEPAERGIMQAPPRGRDEGILSKRIGIQIAWMGALIGGLSIATQAWAISHHVAHWQTMVFSTLTFAQLFGVLGIRLERDLALGRAFFTNPSLLGAVALTTILQLAAIYVPFFNALLKTQPLTAGELAWCFSCAAIAVVAVELEKLVASMRRATHGAARPTETPGRSAR
jgi:Ca2+-transporting ATPase